MIFRNIIFLLIVLMPTVPANARFLHIWSYEELLGASDLVAIIEPVSSEGTKDIYPGFTYGHELADFSGNNTKFKVHAILKGSLSPQTPLIILHFSYSKKVTVIVNGARFAKFVSGPLQFKKQVLKDEKEVGGVTTYAEKPIWLAFLKKRDDGRYEPVTDPNGVKLRRFRMKTGYFLRGF